MRTTVAVADVIYDPNPTYLSLPPSTIRCLIILIILLYFYFLSDE